MGLAEVEVEERQAVIPRHHSKKGIPDALDNSE